MEDIALTLYVRAGGQLHFRRFPVNRPLETVRRGRLDSGRVAVDAATQGHAGRRHRALPAADRRPAAADLEAVGAIGPFSTSTVRRAFIRAAERIGIHGVRPYDLRHSYGTALYRVAGDTRLVKDVLGHSDTRTRG